MRSRLRLASWCAACFLAAAPTAPAQVADQVVLFGINAANKQGLARFDRKLNYLGSSTTTTLVGASSASLVMSHGATVDAQGRYWVPFDALEDMKLLRMNAGGSKVLPIVMLQNNPVRSAASQSGIVYALTRIPLSGNAPLYAVGANGSVLWSNLAGPSLFTGYPDELVITSTGHIWIAGSKPNGSFPTFGLLAEVSAATGEVVDQWQFDKPPQSQNPYVDWGMMAATPDGTLWGELAEVLTEVDTATHQILREYVEAAGSNGTTQQLRVDAHGDLYLVSPYTAATDWGGDIVKVGGTTGQVIETYKLEFGSIVGFALGPSGEDLYAVVVPATPPPYSRRLVRLNLVTGLRSSILLDTYGTQWAIPNDDPTGFIFANVIDQAGDNDGDGATNHQETLAGSDPFDPTSRPNGPKVYISFAPVTNALALTFEDPDGLIDPQGGLDVSTLSLSIGHYNNIFNYLLPFVTGLDVSPDFKQATLTFGGLPLPSDKKWQVEVHVSDMTGAVGWDWQVTPPGDL